MALLMSVTVGSRAGSMPLILMNASARLVVTSAMPMMAGAAPHDPRDLAQLAHVVLEVVEAAVALVDVDV
jgi:hypothetical protein